MRATQVRLFLYLLLNGTSALFRLFVPRVEQMRHVKNDLKQTSRVVENNLRLTSLHSMQKYANWYNNLETPAAIDPSVWESKLIIVKYLKS